MAEVVRQKKSSAERQPEYAAMVDEELLKALAAWNTKVQELQAQYLKREAKEVR